jgi:hypothetical protein
MSTEEFAGTWRLRDEVESVDLFAGVRVWVAGSECGFSMNDGKGGPAESIVFDHIAIRWAFLQMLALLRRKAYRYKRESARPNFRPLLRNRTSIHQQPCNECDASGFATRSGVVSTCTRCNGTGWMDPEWLVQFRASNPSALTERHA